MQIFIRNECHGDVQRLFDGVKRPDIPRCSSVFYVRQCLRRYTGRAGELVDGNVPGFTVFPDTVPEPFQEFFVIVHKYNCSPGAKVLLFFDIRKKKMHFCFYCDSVYVLREELKTNHNRHWL